MPARITLPLAVLLALTQPRCSPPCASQLYTARVDGGTTVSAEYQYFDEGMCTGFCRRLRDCGVLCQSLEPTSMTTCSNDDPAAFEQCLHGALLVRVFGISSCPHACPSVSRFVAASPCDALNCGSSAYARSCQQSGRGSIGDLFREGTAECTGACQ